jgi:putative RNA 2'-phosphotransferase
MTVAALLTPEARSKASRFLSGSLRHSHHQLPMDQHGYTPTADLLQAMQNRGLLSTPEEFLEVVFHDEKGRFEFSPDSHDEEGIVFEGSRLRACSGHSVEVNLDLEPFQPAGPLYFGTVIDALPRILAEGMTWGTRRHIRLVHTENAARAVAIGRGKAGPVVFRINAEAMAANGHAFYRANNDEVLVTSIPAAFIERVG